LGTDCRPEAIRAAQSGTFDLPLVAHVPAHLKEKYLIRQGQQYRVSDQLLGRARWRCADLLRSVESGGWDMILCRNLAMYLSLSARENSGKSWIRNCCPADG